MRICWNNFVENSTITETSFLSGYSVENIKLPNLSRKFKFDGNSGNLVFDLGSALNIKVAVIGNTNITSSGTLTLEGNSSDSWGAPGYQQSITVDDDTKNQAIFLDETYRYWRIVFSDATLTDIEIGYVFLGAYLQIDKWNLRKKKYITTAKSSITETRQLYGKAGIDYKGWDINLFFDDSELDSFLTMKESNQGIDPVWLFLHESTFDDFPPVFSKLGIENLDVSEPYIANSNEFSISIEEVY